MFFPADVEMFRVQADGAGLFGDVPVEHMTRAVGAATRNLIEATLALMPESYGDVRELPLVDQLQLSSSASQLLRRLIDSVPALLVHQAREAAAFAATATFTRTGQRPLAIGFCDLVSSTAMTNASPETMALAVTEFEKHATDAVVIRGGRLVKFVGDEVMFATPALPETIEIALDLVDWVAEDDHLAGARAGGAHGLVTTRDGDIYGASVNLASRLASIAPPGAILVADDTGDETIAVQGFDEPIRVRTIGPAGPLPRPSV